VASRLTQFLLAALCALLLAAPASAITGGTYDGDNHPYVGLVSNGFTFCSGTLLSPRVFLTAAHCAAGMTSMYGDNGGAPTVHVSFDPALGTKPRDQRGFYIGTFYADAYNPNLPNNAKDPDNHDEAIVVFDSPLPPEATLGKYGALPTAGVVDGLGMNTPLDLVGFGVQDVLGGGGKNTQPDLASALLRLTATAQLIAANDETSSRFIKLHQNQGGFCFGDSGGPDLLAGTATVVALNAFATNALCTGVGYSYRVDTPRALSWIRSTAASHGAAF
jgi:trypsin